MERFMSALFPGENDPSPRGYGGWQTPPEGTDSPNRRDSRRLEQAVGALRDVYGSAPDQLAENDRGESTEEERIGRGSASSSGRSGRAELALARRRRRSRLREAHGVCRHAHGCKEHAVRRAIRAGIASFSVKWAIETVLDLVKGRDRPEDVVGLIRWIGSRAWKRLASRDSARFALFASALVLLGCGTRCAMAQSRGVDDRVGRFVAGLVAGVALMLDAPERRTDVALNVATRAGYALLHALMRRGLVKRVPRTGRWLFALSNIPIAYALIVEPHLLDRSYYEWIVRTAGIPIPTINATIREPYFGLLNAGAPERARTIAAALYVSEHGCCPPDCGHDAKDKQEEYKVFAPRDIGARQATGRRTMTAKGWSGADATLGTPGGSRALSARYRNAQNVANILQSRGTATASQTPLEMAQIALEHITSLSSSTDHAAPSDIVQLAARLHDCPKADILPGVMMGPKNFRRCDRLWHPGRSCIRAHIEDAPALFLRSLLVYAPVHVIPLLLFRTAQISKAPVTSTLRMIRALTGSTLFFSSYVTFVKLTICFLRTHAQADLWWHTAVAGLAGSAGLAFEDDKRASELMLFCLPKAIDIVWQLLERQGWVSRVKGGEVFVFALGLAVALALDRRDFRPMYGRLLDFLGL